MNRLLIISVVVATLAIAGCQADCGHEIQKGMGQCSDDATKYMKKASEHKDQHAIVCCLFNWTINCMFETIKKNCPELGSHDIDSMVSANQMIVGGLGANCPRQTGKDACKEHFKKVGAGASTIAVPTIMASFLALFVLFLK